MSMDCLPRVCVWVCKGWGRRVEANGDGSLDALPYALLHTLVTRIKEISITPQTEVTDTVPYLSGRGSVETGEVGR